jgi:uncharacterized protein (DUF58 family)
MITSRGWWFVIIVLSLLALGVFGEQTARVMSGERWTLILLSLTLLLWFLAEWCLFGLRVLLAIPQVRVYRELRDSRGPVATLWAGRSFDVHIHVRLAHWLRLPYVRTSERIPFGLEHGGDERQEEGSLSAEDSLKLVYKIRCPAAGQIRFEGVKVEVADLQGLFYATTFVRAPVVYSVLPPLADAGGNRPSVKRHNLLPSPGVHRHLRPGSGSELLDLRDYLPGDPPKTIAWKVSARRDRLVTKEFESEVPVRCTLFVDCSHSVRVGGAGQNALSRLVDICAAVASARQSRKQRLLSATSRVFACSTTKR